MKFFLTEIIFKDDYMKIMLSKKDIIWSYIGTIISMGANLIMLPFLMHYLDEDRLGMWYVFVSIGTIATLFDMGFAVTFARNITYCWSGAKHLKKENVEFVENSEPDFKLMKDVLFTCKIIYGILAGAALLLLLTAGTGYISYISRGLTGSTHLIAWVIYAVAVFLNLYYGYYVSFLRGVGAVDRANKNTAIARMLQIALTIVLLFLGAGIIGACIAYLVYGTVFRLLGKYYFYNYQGIGDKLTEIKEKTDRSCVKEMLGIAWYNAWRDGMISICNYFCNQASTVICSIYLLLSQTGVYSIGVQIASAIAQIAGTLYNAYQPELQSSYINKDEKKTRRMMSMIVMSFVYLFILGTIAFSVVGIPFLRIVKPTAVASVPVFWGLCTYQFILKIRNCYTSYFSCTNRIIYMNGFIVSAILCVALSFIAIGLLDLGVWGLIGAQIISQAVYNLWKWPKLAHSELKLSACEMVCIGTKECIRALKKLLGNKNWDI